jgi:hypothetical protein
MPYRITKEGKRVTCNGFPGVVSKVCTGQLDGMLEVRLDRGGVCVDASTVSVPIYRNRYFKIRDYEATNIVACSPVDEDATIPPQYDPAPASALKGLAPLWIEAGIQYWGWL